VRQLSLANNNLTEFSPTLARLNLNRLDVRGNRIKILPSYLVCQIHSPFSSAACPSSFAFAERVEEEMQLLYRP